MVYVDEQFWPEFTRTFCLIYHTFWPLLLFSAFPSYFIFFFFFFGTFGPDRMGLTAPSEYGIAKGQLIFLFVSHGQPSASRLPYHPLRGWGITPLRGVITRRLKCAHACELQFWPVWTSFGFNFAAGFWPKLWPKLLLSTSEMQEECCKSLILKQWYHYIVKFSFSLIFLVLAYWENSAFLVWYN